MNREAERKRLVELLNNSFKKELGTNLHNEILDKFAQNLLDNGIVVPPVKVGDTVYKPIITDDTHEAVIWDITITQISIERGKLLTENYAIGKICKGNSGISFDFKDIGKTVFLTREQAVQALKGGESNA